MSAPAYRMSARDHRYNDLTTQLDRAIRHLNYAKDYDRRGRGISADSHRLQAAVILESINPEILIIDPEAIL